MPRANRTISAIDANLIVSFSDQHALTKLRKRVGRPTEGTEVVLGRIKNNGVDLVVRYTEKGPVYRLSGGTKEDVKAVRSRILNEQDFFTDFKPAVSATTPAEPQVEISVAAPAE